MMTQSSFDRVAAVEPLTDLPAPSNTDKDLRLRPLFAPVSSILDLVASLTWRLAGGPRLAATDDQPESRDSTRFYCPACERVWLVPLWLNRAFAFRCRCGERMIVHLDERTLSLT
jgi:hypothetical protein